MNTRNERIEYFKNFNTEIPLPIEELFIANCLNNSYLMSSLKKFAARENLDLKVTSIENMKYNLSLIIASLDNIDMDNIKFILSIFAYIEKENRYDVLEYIFKRGFKNIYKTVQGENKNYHINYIEDTIPFLFIFASLNFDLNIPSEFILSNMRESALISLYNITLIEVPDDMRDKLFSKYEKFITSNKLDKPFTLNDLTKLYMEKTMKDLRISYEDSDFVSELSDRILDGKAMKDKNLLSMFNSLRFNMECVDSFSLNSNKIFSVKLTKDDLAVILFLLHTSEEMFPNIDISGPEFFDKFTTAAAVYTVSSINNERSSIVLELMAREREYEKEKDALVEEFNKAKNSLLALNQKMLSENTVLIEENDALHKEIVSLKSFIRNNIKTKEIEEANKKELLSLREFIFNLEHNYDNYDSKKEHDSELNDNYKIAFVGSEQSVHNRLKEYYPNIIFVTADEINRDLNYLKKMDYIFLHTHISHAMYYKVIELIKSTNASLTFINATNTDIIKNQIHKTIYRK